VVIGETAIVGDRGPIRVGDHAKIGANAPVINRDVPADSTAVGTPARIVKLAGKRADLELPPTAPQPGAVPVEV
jgi:serine O-acetyltransferase